MNDIAHESFHELMAAQVESGAMPGLVALVAHGGDVDVVVAGRKDFGDDEPLCRDAIPHRLVDEDGRVDGGWGLGMGTPVEFCAGGFGWDGGTGTSWRTALSRDLTGILFTQRAMTSPEPPAAFQAFSACADAIAAD
ncbi:MAG: hypothetical protein ABIR68_13275 [Ilumatobacteraceae bacterium]